jgi:hypothetical protein
MKTYEITIYATVEASSLEEAEMLYSNGEYSIDYHEISDYDDFGNEIKYDQRDIEEMGNNA